MTELFIKSFLYNIEKEAGPFFWQSAWRGVRKPFMDAGKAIANKRIADAAGREATLRATNIAQHAAQKTTQNVGQYFKQEPVKFVKGKSKSINTEKVISKMQDLSGTKKQNPFKLKNDQLSIQSNKNLKTDNAPVSIQSNKNLKTDNAPDMKDWWKKNKSKVLGGATVGAAGGAAFGVTKKLTQPKDDNRR